MKKFAVQAVALLIVIFAGAAFYTSRIPVNPFLENRLPLGEVIINGVSLKVEVAGTKEARNKGLGGRESLASGSGMLFVFDSADKYPFWMKGIKFPLDFIWIRNNTVVDFLENVPPAQEGQKDESLKRYGPSVPVDRVLEVPAGTIKRLNIKPGDTVKIVRS